MTAAALETKACQMDQGARETSVLLVQSESENRIHRILYLLRYLRAMILHIVLIVIAVTLYLSFGISGLYPLATDQIAFVEAQTASGDASFFSFTPL